MEDMQEFFQNSGFKMNLDNLQDIYKKCDFDNDG